MEQEPDPAGWSFPGGHSHGQGQVGEALQPPHGHQAQAWGGLRGHAGTCYRGPLECTAGGRSLGADRAAGTQTSPDPDLGLDGRSMFQSPQGRTDTPFQPQRHVTVHPATLKKCSEAAAAAPDPSLRPDCPAPPAWWCPLSAEAGISSLGRRPFCALSFPGLPLWKPPATLDPCLARPTLNPVLSSQQPMLAGSQLGRPGGAGDAGSRVLLLHVGSGLWGCVLPPEGSAGP